MACTDNVMELYSLKQKQKHKCWSWSVGSLEHIFALGKRNTFHMWITPSTGVKRFESKDNAIASLSGLENVLNKPFNDREVWNVTTIN
jgi:hypothetical protein